MLVENIDTQVISLTPSAAQAVKDLLTKRNLEGYALRVFVSGGGCSGFQYGIALEGNIRPEDFTSEFDGVKVVVDEVTRPCSWRPPPARESNSGGSPCAQISRRWSKTRGYGIARIRGATTDSAVRLRSR